MGSLAKSAAPKSSPDELRPPRPAHTDARKDRDRLQTDLWRAYRRRPGSTQRNRLVESYRPFVLDVVRRFAQRLPRTVELSDLETAGSVGLMNAVESFDPERGVRFEAYCELRVKGALLDELRQQDWLPRPWRSRLERHKRAVERLRGEQSGEPNEEDLARELDMTLLAYRRFFGSAMPLAPAGSSQTASGDDDDGFSLDVVPDTQSEAPGERLTREDLLRLVAQRLTEQEYRIVYLRYWEELSMREIGQIESLSESRVCKIHSRLLERLKSRFGADND
ncbi:MAG TPA: sigma-70 family RNA polymerase sigma factor [Planctomycetota bacterium]|nr:sigma-70 family RNA polymerase sigma factor [Planctomycetota bacterium]